MPLTSNPSKNIERLTNECKAGGFGNIKGKSFETCRRAAVAAGINAAKRRQKGRRKSTRR